MTHGTTTSFTPGSGCSIMFGDLPQNQMEPGSMKALQLEMSDAAAARRELLDRGVEASDLMVMAESDGGTFFGFRDPDGNSWAVQEIKARAEKQLIPKDHTGLSEWAGRSVVTETQHASSAPPSPVRSAPSDDPLRRLLATLRAVALATARSCGAAPIS